ncbi:Protein MIS12 [Glycine soja]|nr:hypothetical protein JHK87_046627 [Glycine soja]
MEEGDSEAIFGALNLNPQLFCNEVLNIVDDVLDEAFNFFYQDASTKLNIEGTQRSQDLKKGVDCVRLNVQSVLDKQLAAWESYILRHCFALPQGFRMPNTANVSNYYVMLVVEFKAMTSIASTPMLVVDVDLYSICVRDIAIDDDEIPDESNENALDPGAPFDPDIDAQLDSLREKLIEVGKESEMLNQEMQALERKSAVNVAGHINEAVQLYEQNSMHEVFQEIVTTASELGAKMAKLNSSMIEETDQTKTKRIYSTEMDLSAINPAKGLSNMKLDDVEEFVSVMKSM